MTSETVSIPVDVDVNEEVFEVVDGQAIEVGVGLVHLDRIQVFVGRNVFGQLQKCFGLITKSDYLLPLTWFQEEIARSEQLR